MSVNLLDVLEAVDGALILSKTPELEGYIKKSAPDVLRGKEGEQWVSHCARLLRIYFDWEAEYAKTNISLPPQELRKAAKESFFVPCRDQFSDAQMMEISAFLENARGLFKPLGIMREAAKLPPPGIKP